MKKLFVGLLLLGILLLSFGCTENAKNSDAIQAKQTEVALAEAQRQIGMPSIVNFQQKKLLRTIFELCDKENLICYAYIKSD